ncbi:MAG: septum formation inhibitor [Salinivirgaceae bacterium]|nr:septum formation inhibitor [Salinivirgaceae bacterium]
MNLNPKLKKIIDRLNNKFVIASLIFLLWILFFDQNNLLNRISDLRNLREMKAQKEYYEKKIETDIQRTKELETDDDNLEKFAREQYLMKKANEDVFVIVEE